VFGRDGRTLGYVESTFPSDTAESWSAVVLELDADAGAGGERARLRQPGSLKSGCPRWSPDLTRLAFVTSPTDRDGDLELVNVDGSTVTLLTGAEGPLELAGWSPDGRSLAVIRTSGPDLTVSELLVVATDGSPARALAPGWPIGSISWSADGSEIGFVTVDAATDAKAMAMVDVRKGDVRMIDVGAEPGGPAWSPDGSRIAFVSDGRVVVSAPDGTDRRVLPPVQLGVPAYVQGVRWSPDGTHLLVTAGDANFIDRGVHFAVALVDPAGMGSPQLIAPWQLGFYTDVAWQSVPR
jgi:Tol biopolymer transport system component